MTGPRAVIFLAVACLFLAVAWLPFGSPVPSTRADEGLRRTLVLGPDGRPARQVLLTEVTRTEDGTSLFDGQATGDVRELTDGILETTVPREGVAQVLWGPGWGATILPRGDTTVVGVRLVAACPLQGRLRLARGVPAVGLEVRASRSGEALVHVARTDETGRWRLDHLAGGRWVVHVRRADGREQPLGLFAAGEAVCESVVPAGGSVRGQVLDG
ncbi:MAG: carboxypeptidase-like regulatory domain-containing protein, partial [Planctomycetota bacterium]